MSKLELILSRLSGVNKGPQYRANCPCPHHKKVENQHLYIKDGDDNVILYCQAGCTAQEVLYEIELQLKDLYPDSTPAEREIWKEKQKIANATEKNNKAAIRLWVELCVIKEMLQARIFSGDSQHPGNITECMDREKQAVRMLSKYFNDYYSFK